LAAQAPGETAVRRMQVQYPQRPGAGNGESVTCAGRRRDEASGPEAVHLVARREVALALEDEKRIGEVVVRVRVDALELRKERHLEDRQLVELALDQVRRRL